MAIFLGLGRMPRPGNESWPAHHDEVEILHDVVDVEESLAEHSDVTSFNIMRPNAVESGRG